MKPQPKSPEWYEQQAALLKQLNDPHQAGISSPENPVCPVCGRRHDPCPPPEDHYDNEGHRIHDA